MRALCFANKSFSQHLYCSTSRHARTAGHINAVGILENSNHGLQRNMNKNNKEVAVPIRTSNQCRSFCSFFSDPAYKMRQSALGLADKSVLKSAAAQEDIVFVDVRSLEEIAKDQLSRPFVHASFLLEEQADDEQRLDELIPDKEATIIVFCRSGARAKAASENLQKRGYQNVYNAGGVSDIDFL